MKKNNIYILGILLLVAGFLYSESSSNNSPNYINGIDIQSPPGNSISETDPYFPIGTAYTAQAEGEGSVKYDPPGNGIQPDNNTAQQIVITKSDEEGDKKLNIASTNSRTVTLVEVAKVSGGGASDPIESNGTDTITVPLGTVVTFQATSNPLSDSGQNLFSNLNNKPDWVVEGGVVQAGTGTGHEICTVTFNEASTQASLHKKVAASTASISSPSETPSDQKKINVIVAELKSISGAGITSNKNLANELTNNETIYKNRTSSPNNFITLTANMNITYSDDMELTWTDETNSTSRVTEIQNTNTAKFDISDITSSSGTVVSVTYGSMTKRILIKVIGVESIFIEEIPGKNNLDLILATSDPGGVGGWRVFPGKQTPTDTEDRTRVKITAKLNIQKAGETIYFLPFDVDDPSANSLPLDNESGGVSGDNKNTSGPTGVALVTDSEGKAEARLKVSFAPGNNYRIGATLGNDINSVNMHNVPTANEPIIPGLPGRYTKVLTVWRKLHIEYDSMSAVTGNSVSDTIDTITHMPGGRSKLNVNITLPGAVDVYEGGTLRVDGITYQVRTNTDYFATDDDIVVEGIVPTTNAGMTFVLKDDDRVSLPQNASGGALLTSAFADAYILPVDVGSLNTNPVTGFDLNLTDTEQATGWQYDNAQDISTQARYWAALAVAAYQAGEPYDLDPDHLYPGFTWTPGGRLGSLPPDSSIEYGSTVETQENVSIIFLETVREYHGITIVQETDENHTFVHEIGHTGGTTGGTAEHAELGLMQDGAPHTVHRFSDTTLHRFRTTTTW